MNGGGGDDFFSIYGISKYNEATKTNPVIGILFYNHKTKKFHLFINHNDVGYHNDAIKLIAGLYGFNIILNFNHTFDLPRNEFDYYFIFDGKKLYSARYIPGNTAAIETFTKHQIEPESPVSPTQTQLNKETQTQTVAFNDINFTFTKLVDETVAKSKYQPFDSYSLFVDNTKQRIESAFNMAIENKATAVNKAAGELEICKVLQTKIQPAKNALDEIDKIKSFFETNRGTMTKEEIKTKWKREKTPEEITRIDKLIGDLLETKKLINANITLCSKYLRSIHGIDLINIIHFAFYTDSSHVFDDIIS